MYVRNCEKDLSIDRYKARFGARGFSRRREKTMMIACSSNQTYLYLSHYISCRWVGVYIR
jgi:hypothetical protein